VETGLQVGPNETSVAPVNRASTPSPSNRSQTLCHFMTNADERWKRWGRLAGQTAAGLQEAPLRAPRQSESGPPQQAPARRQILSGRECSQWKIQQGAKPAALAAKFEKRRRAGRSLFVDQNATGDPNDSCARCIAELCISLRVGLCPVSASEMRPWKQILQPASAAWSALSIGASPAMCSRPGWRLAAHW
jgi:hypothetical protein